MIRILVGAVLALFGLMLILTVVKNPNAPAPVTAALIFLGLFVVPGAFLTYFGQRALLRSKPAVATPTPAPARGPVERHPATTGKESISLLIPKLCSSDVDVRAAAAEQVGQLADPAGVQPLVDLMHEESLRILRGTLGLYGGMVGLYGGVFSMQRGRLPIPATDAGEHERLIKARVRRKAADALCRIGAPAVPALIQMLQDPDERFLMGREEAARVLGELKAKEALPALTAVLPCGGDLAALARAALEHIRSQDADLPKQNAAPVRPSAPTATSPAPTETLGDDKIERLLAGLKEYDDTLQALLRGLELGYARSVLNTDLEYLAHLDLGHMLRFFFNIRDPQQLARLQPVLQTIHSRAEAAGKFIEGGARIPASAQEIVDKAMQLSQTPTPYPQGLYMIIPNILMVTQSCLGHAANVLGPVTRAPSPETPP